MEETDNQLTEPLILELQKAFTLPNAGGAELTSSYEVAIKGRQAFVLFRVFDVDVWLQIVSLMLEFETGFGFRFKVAKRYLRIRGKMGFLWEITIDADNLPEAVVKFRRILASCLHQVVGGLAPNYPEHGMVEAAEEPAPPPEVVSKLVVKPRKPRDPKVPNMPSPKDQHRGVMPAGSNTDGSFRVQADSSMVLPSKSGRVGPQGFEPPKGPRVKLDSEGNRL